jgi:taurine dioxygenase
MNNPAIRAGNDAGTLSITKTGTYIGAEVTGIDLRLPLDHACIEKITTAHAEHGVLAFPDQPIDSAQLMAFGRRFGELSVHPFSTNAVDTPELIVYDNKEGNPPASTDVWHSDETFRECPPLGTMLCSKIIPPLGGDTVFANMASAYEGLSDRMQQLISGLEAVHDFKPFKTLFAQSEQGRKKLRHFEERYPAVTHPVVTRHPLTGRRVLFVNPQFTLYIKGMEERESQTLLDTLFRQASIPEYQYRHRWQPNMLVFWDNRLAQHYAVHDYYPQRRLLERVTIKGEKPIAADAAADPDELRRLKTPRLTDLAGRRATRQFERD